MSIKFEELEETGKQMVSNIILNTTKKLQITSSNVIQNEIDGDSFYGELAESNYLTKGSNSLVFIVLYSVSIIIGLIVNSIVIVTVIKYRHMRTITNAFIVNLTVFDLLVILFCMPSRLLNEINSQWFLYENGEFLCKISSFMQDSAVGGSILTLTFISCTRIYAVNHPFKVKRFLTKFKLIILIILIWTVVFIFSTPSLLFKQMHKTEITLNVNHVNKTLIVKACIEDWTLQNRIYKKSYNLLFFVFFYFIPLIIIFTNYLSIALQMFDSNLLTDENFSHLKPLTNTFSFTDGCTQTINTNVDIRTKCFKNKFREKNKYEHELSSISRISSLPRNKFKIHWASEAIDQEYACGGGGDGGLSHSKKFWKTRYHQRRKICKMFVLISGMFGISWAPMHIINFIIELDIYNNLNIKYLNIFYYYALWFGHLNSILNPLCYALCCKKFQQCYNKK